MGLTFTRRRRRITVLGWPTNVISIDPKVDHDGNHPHLYPRNSSGPVHTILFWIPGNPGQHDWYNSDFMDVLSGLGRGYAVRSISHAAHGLSGESNGGHGGSDANSIIDVKEYCSFRGRNDGARSASPLIPWTVEGQVLHKIAYIDSLLSSIEEEIRQHRQQKGKGSCKFTTDLKFIFIGHSFGCHVIQRMCTLRPDILERVSGFLFLMPYIRTKPSLALDQRKLEFGGSHPELLISIGTKFSELLRFFPESVLQSVIRTGLQSDKDSGGNGRGTGEDENRIANITAAILRNPLYPRNFFELGTEELRDIPNEIDMAALSLLSSYRPSSSQNTEERDCRLERPRKQQQHRPIFILYAGDHDQWCPSFHGEEIKVLQSTSLLPPSIKTTKIHGLRHDYVCQSRSKRTRVNDWIISNIIETKNNSRLTNNTTDNVNQHNIVDEGFGDGGYPRPKTPILRSKL